MTSCSAVLLADAGKGLPVAILLLEAGVRTTLDDLDALSNRTNHPPHPARALSSAESVCSAPSPPIP